MRVKLRRVSFQVMWAVVGSCGQLWAGKHGLTCHQRLRMTHSGMYLFCVLVVATSAAQQGTNGPHACFQDKAFLVTHPLSKVTYDF